MKIEEIIKKYNQYCSDNKIQNHDLIVEWWLAQLQAQKEEIIKLAEGMIKLNDTDPGGYNQAL